MGTHLWVGPVGRFSGRTRAARQGTFIRGLCGGKTSFSQKKGQHPKLHMRAFTFTGVGYGFSNTLKWALDIRLIFEGMGVVDGWS